MKKTLLLIVVFVLLASPVWAGRAADRLLMVWPASGTACSTLQQSNTNAENNKALGDVAVNLYWAGKFTATAYNVCKVEFYLKKVGNPNFNVNAYIYGHTGGTPGEPDETNVIATSTTTLVGDSLTTSYAWTPFENPDAALSNGVTYWLVLKASGYHNSSNYVSISIDSVGSYQMANSSDGATWTVNSAYIINYRTYSD